MSKHPETADHPALMLGGMLRIGGHLNNVDAVREWIEGFR
jgi:hypothetical protein